MSSNLKSLIIFPYRYVISYVFIMFIMLNLGLYTKVITIIIRRRLYTLHKETCRIFRIQPDLVSASKIDYWWFRRRQNEQYHLLARNCATVVRDALVVELKDQFHIWLLKLMLTDHSDDNGSTEIN